MEMSGREFEATSDWLGGQGTEAEAGSSSLGRTLLRQLLSRQRKPAEYFNSRHQGPLISLKGIRWYKNKFAEVWKWKSTRKALSSPGVDGDSWIQMMIWKFTEM